MVVISHIQSTENSYLRVQREGREVTRGEGEGEVIMTLFFIYL